MIRVSILLCFLGIICKQINAQNIQIGYLNEPNEPSIMLDPKHPNRMVAGTNISNYYYSSDSGFTWNEGRLVSKWGVWGDPTISVDTAGNFYFFHLSNPDSGTWIDRIICQKSLDSGSTWTNESYTGLNLNKAQDKQWCVVDRTNNNLYLTWTQFDVYGSNEPLDSSVILFSKSTDAGTTWSTPKRINKYAGNCIDSDSTVEGAVPAIGPNGEIYVGWAGPKGLVFNKSTDQGNTWLKEEIIVDTLPGGWEFSVPEIFRTDGLPITACDLSLGPNRGTIYMNWSDQRNGVTNTDIWLAKSTDGGNTWSKPKRVNDDNTNKHQFFTWMAIDQTNGYLYFVFYDRRNYNNALTDVYMAVSMDGGNTFINRKISESPFLPFGNLFFGDYTNLTVNDGVIRPIWTRMSSGELSIWTSITRLSDFLNTSVSEESLLLNNLSFENYPNPTNDYEFVSFKLRTKSNVNLTIYDIDGRIVSEVIKNESRDYGKYIERISMSDLGIQQGTYFLRLEINGTIKINRVIKL